MILISQNLAEDGESWTPRFPCDSQNSNTKGELMIGRYGERISIYSEDLSVTTHPNEFRFCTSHFYNQWWNGTCKNKLIHSFFNRKRQASVSIRFGKLEFYYKIHTSRTKASLNGKLSVRDNQLFMNWYGKPIDSLLYRESISVLHVTLL